MIEELLKDPRALGIAGLLGLIVVAFVKEWIVPGSSYTRAIAERDVQIIKLVSERDEFKEKVWVVLNIVDRTQKVRVGEPGA